MKEHGLQSTVSYKTILHGNFPYVDLNSYQMIYFVVFIEKINDFIIIGLINKQLFLDLS